MNEKARVVQRRDTSRDVQEMQKEEGPIQQKSRAPKGESEKTH